MTLDIDPAYVTFNLYSRPDRAVPTMIKAAKLYPPMQRTADRYLGPTGASRASFAVSTG